MIKIKSMNSNAKKSIITMEKDELRQLVSEIKETVAADVSLGQQSVRQSVFSAADLWYIQKMKKRIAPRKTFIL